MEGVGRLLGECGEAVWMMRGDCLEAVGRLSAGCGKAVWGCRKAVFRM